ncbi:MAG: DAK2 domain-containing protein, partial [Acidimicrobiales bacterium]
MPVLDRLEADHLRAAVLGYRDALAAHKEAINRLNVYPVPDGDTGTNMALTLESVSAELDAADADLVSTCKAISHGSLMGARGNSGVILSQILRGISDVVCDRGGADGPTVAAALRAATDAAYAAVMRPVEGTILTVVRGCAEAAEAQGAATLVDVLEA